MRLLLFLYILFFSFKGINSKEKIFNCDDIIKTNGFYLLKYTFVKFSGTCYIFDDNEQLTTMKNYEEGEEHGVFKKFKNGIITKIFHMKNNLLDGYYKEFKDKKLVKKVLYEEGEILNCEIDINYLIQKEIKLRKLEKSNNEKNKVFYDKLLKSLKNEKTECRIIEYLN
tara:strand:- start:395 stop:901 length:507 start_codon:yes stop_codon:yes gene_type:complete